MVLRLGVKGLKRNGKSAFGNLGRLKQQAKKYERSGASRIKSCTAKQKPGGGSKDPPHDCLI
jgi:hypothetical protein